MSKHHGMLFADRLMPSMLDGSKTQTRRPVKFKDSMQLSLVEYARDGMPIWWRTEPSDAIRQSDYYDKGMPCPFGQVGDLIWCRETWATTEQAGNHKVDAWPVYRATDPDWGTMEGWRWRPSIHMPKWACRCWKEITDVRVQRIQEISEEDAIAEGVPCLGGRFIFHNALFEFARDAFIESWSSLYPGSWERNDWVWALTFKPAKGPQ